METEQKLQRAHPRAVLLVSDVIGGEEAEGVHTVFARVSKGDVQYQKHKLHPFCLDDSYVAVGQSSSTPDNIFVPPQPDTSVCEYSFCATSGQSHQSKLVCFAEIFRFPCQELHLDGVPPVTISGCSTK